MPEEATVEEVEQLFVEGWRLGLKAVAIYRDNCKVAQPLSADKKKTRRRREAEPARARVVREEAPAAVASGPAPSRSASATSEGYITAGEYPDDGIGEIFLKVSKQGSTLSGIMDAFSIAVSVGLQYGVPLEDYVSKFINMRFEPSGMTNDPDIRFASSLVDYIFRRLALEYLPPETARRAGDQVDRRAQGGGPARDRGSSKMDDAEQPTRCRGAARAGDRSRRPSAPRGPGRAAVLPVRLEDAAGRLVLRVRELRQHQRLLVSRGRP